MSGMLRWMPEQARQMNTPREQEPHAGSAGKEYGKNKCSMGYTWIKGALGWWISPDRDTNRQKDGGAMSKFCMAKNLGNN